LQYRTKELNSHSKSLLYA